MSHSERFARHVALDAIGEAGQTRIGAASVMVVGVGGLGCPAALYLATSGAGRLVLNDFDVVDESNLPRQVLFRPGDVGRRKVHVAAEVLSTLRPDLSVDALTDRLDESGFVDALKAVDIVLDCTDNFATRLVLNAACVRARVALVSGAALRHEGQVAVFANQGTGPCYRCLYSEADEMLGSCQGNGVLAPVPGVIGTLMANEALLRIATGNAPLEGRLLLWDGLRGSWQSLGLQADPDCPVCSRRTPG